MIKFNVGINAVQAGQKSSTVNAEPRLIANSTPGKFQITGIVSRALDVAVGQNIEFFNNIDGLEKLANKPNEDVLAYCQEAGININTTEGKRAFVAANTVWFIAKGHQRFNSAGKPIMCKIRCTKEDKMEAIAQNGADMIKDEDFRAVLIERVGNENASDEELINAITVEDIDSPEVESYTGSKTATAGNATGVGLTLNFTDTSIWTAMKADLEEKDTVNRVFKVLLDQPVETPVNDGFKNITVVAYPVEYLEDVEPKRIGKDE